MIYLPWLMNTATAYSIGDPHLFSCDPVSNSFLWGSPYSRTKNTHANRENLIKHFEHKSSPHQHVPLKTFLSKMLTTRRNPQKWFMMLHDHTICTTYRMALGQVTGYPKCRMVRTENNHDGSKCVAHWVSMFDPWYVCWIGLSPCWI